MQQLTTDSTSPMGRIVSRWARQAEDFATGHVREAFAGLWARLQKAAASGGSATNFVTAVLALAGSDTADHEATMQQAEELARADVACVARVGPDDFRSLQLAVRRICFQLTRDGGRVGAEAYPEEEEDEDAEPLRQGGCAGGALDFVDWRKERGLTGPLVLLISQADTVPKDTMGAVISCWAAACGDNDIPMVVLFGLQQPPQGRFDLLESDPLGNLRLESVGCLFDEDLVCNQLLEHIVSDPSCPLALAPELLQKLRNLFLYTRHSVSYVMKTLALLCEQALSENPLAAALCPPLDETVMPSNKARPLGTRPQRESPREGGFPSMGRFSICSPPQGFEASICRRGPRLWSFELAQGGTLRLGRAMTPGIRDPHFETARFGVVKNRPRGVPDPRAAAGPVGEGLRRATEGGQGPGADGAAARAARARGRGGERDPPLSTGSRRGWPTQAHSARRGKPGL